ncbi:hypothetical protein [Azotosporobacter soli]
MSDMEKTATDGNQDIWILGIGSVVSLLLLAIVLHTCHRLFS